MQKSATARLARKKFVIVLSRLDTSTTRITSKLPIYSTDADNACNERERNTILDIFLFPHNNFCFLASFVFFFHWYSDYSCFSPSFLFRTGTGEKSKFRFYYNSLSQLRLNLDAPHYALRLNIYSLIEIINVEVPRLLQNAQQLVLVVCKYFYFFFYFQFFSSLCISRFR